MLLRELKNSIWRFVGLVPPLQLWHLVLILISLILTGTDWRGALRERFVGLLPPLAVRGALRNVLWDTCPPCSCGSWFLILVID